MNDSYSSCRSQALGILAGTSDLVSDAPGSHAAAPNALQGATASTAANQQVFNQPIEAGAPQSSDAKPPGSATVPGSNGAGNASDTVMKDCADEGKVKGSGDVPQALS